MSLGKKRVCVAKAALILLLLAACSARGPKPEPTGTAQAPTATEIRHYFVTSKLLLPTTQAQTQGYALNVDGDPQQQPDNLLGGLLTLLTSAAPSLNLQSTVDQAVNDGQLVSLHAVKASDLQNAPSVSWSIFQGEKTQSAPRFDGSDKFLLDPAAPIGAPIIGSLKGGHFAGGPGTAQVVLFLFSRPVAVDLVGVRLETDLSARGCTNGKLGGAVTIADFRSKLLPAIVDGLDGMIQTNPSGTTPILQALDSDHNGTITIQELESNPLLMVAASPDMDLLDASGKFNPGQDGVKDSYSVGLGFSCVPAIFAAPQD